MGMGLLGAMGGLGQAGQQIGQQMMQHALREEELSWLEERQNRMAEMAETRKIAQEGREYDRKMAPINRANAAVKQAMSIDVPVEAQEVDQLTGDESTARQGQGMLSGSYRGDPKEIVKDIARIKSDDDKRIAAEALESQLQDAKKANQEAVAGKTRKLSREDAMTIAERSLDGDIEAQTLIKAARGDKYTKVGANETILDRNGRVVFQNKQGEENIKALFENKLELAKAMYEFKSQIGVKSGELPSDAKMAEWLVSNGVAPDIKSAYERVKQGKDKDDLSIQASIFAALRKESTGEDPNTLWDLAGKMVSNGRSGSNGAKPGQPQISKLDSLFPPRK